MCSKSLSSYLILLFLVSWKHPLKLLMNHRLACRLTCTRLSTTLIRYAYFIILRQTTGNTHTGTKNRGFFKKGGGALKYSFYLFRTPLKCVPKKQNSKVFFFRFAIFMLWWQKDGNLEHRST